MMPAMALKYLLSGIEFTGMDVQEGFVQYKAKAKGVMPLGVKARVLLNSLSDIPPRIPRDVEVKLGESGIIFKDYAVTWKVRSTFVPRRPRDMIAEIQEVFLK
jgi:hypothetical protein